MLHFSPWLLNSNSTLKFPLAFTWTLIQILKLFAQCYVDNITLSDPQSSRIVSPAYLVPMSTCFRSMQTCIGLNVEPSGLHFGARLTSTRLRSRHLRVVERHTGTMVFWASFPVLCEHFGNWHRRFDRCHRSESSNRLTWWSPRWPWRVL